MVVAGDISRDGSKIAMRKAKSTEGWMYTRAGGQTVEEALLQTKVSCDLVLEDEPQGESIAFSPDNLGFYTTSEGESQPIYYYPLQ